ncbi:MAG: hypothetical protein DI535_25100 [Citrobacter freundii]|nr:MAG: hypothetical protein DI535_25100 [Citrobacter freundii]
MKGIISTVLLVLIFNGILYAQSVLNITVQDNKGKPVPGAYLHLLNTNHEGYADEKGMVGFASVSAGDYILLVRSAGFNAVTKEVEIRSGASSLVIELTQDSKQLETVIVTAQKKEEVLQSLPASISVLNARTVDAFRLWQAKDLSGIVPNLYAANPGDGRNVISVRGITSTSYDPAVATYIDGVSQFSLDTYIPQLFDIERIEILRGPQGTLYGRNAMGGVINVVSRQPSNNAEGFAEASYGNFSTGRYVAGVRLPLVKNKLFLGLTGIYEHTGGYYKNDLYQSSFDKQHAAGAGYVLKYLPSAKWKMTLNVKHLAARNNGAFPLAASLNDALADPYKVNQDAVTQLVDNTLNASLSVQYFSGKWNLSSQTAYQSNYRYYRSPIDADFSPIDGITIINNYGNDWNRVKTLTQELRFTTIAADSRLKWTGGLFFFHQQSPTRQATHFGEDAMLVGSPDINYAIIGTTRNDNKGLAAYAQAEYQLSHRLQLIAGIRYDYQHSRSNTLGEYLPDRAPAPVFETRPDTTATANYGALSPKLGLNLQVSAKSNLYITFSRGYRTGGLTQFSPDPSQPPLYAYKPEYSNMFELGSKNILLNNTLRVNLALFYSIIADAQVPTLVLPEAITLIRNAGKLTSRGIEAELAAVVVKGLEISYNFGYTHARYNTLKLSSGGTEVDLKGNRQVFTPEVTSMLAIQYSLPLDRRHDVKLITRGEWLCTGVTYFDFANTIRQPSYHLLNARAGLAMRHLELMGWIRNITDRKYIAYAYDFGATHLGRPRSYGATVKYSF